jgi:uncharacterized protein (DUF1697 family)
MQRYIAFLRAINVGGHTVKMEQLRSLFEKIGYDNVATFIASGNVIFESSARSARKLEMQIAGHLHDSLGYEVDTFIRSAPELAAVAAYQPFPAEDLATPGSSLYVMFLHDSPSAATHARLVDLGTETDEFHVHEREIYWFCRTRLSDSPLFSGTLLAKTIGASNTMRNITTVRKLAAKYVPPG